MTDRLLRTDRGAMMPSLCDANPEADPEEYRLAEVVIAASQAQRDAETAWYEARESARRARLHLIPTPQGVRVFERAEEDARRAILVGRDAAFDAMNVLLAYRRERNLRVYEVTGLLGWESWVAQQVIAGEV